MLAIASEAKGRRETGATHRVNSSGVHAALRRDGPASSSPGTLGNQAMLRLSRANSGGVDHLSGSLRHGIRAALRRDGPTFPLPGTTGNQAALRRMHAVSEGSDHLSGMLGKEHESHANGKCSCGGSCSKCQAGKKGGADARLEAWHAGAQGANHPERTANPEHPGSGFEYDLNGVTVQTIRSPLPTQLTAALSPAGKEPAATDEDFITAQHDAGAPAGSGSGSAAPPPPAPACNYTVTYANQHAIGCDGGRCGAGLVYDITGVHATGAGCPSLAGLTVTEVVTNDHGCTPANVQGGAGCPIAAGGAVTNCTDTYSVCLGAVSESKIPPAGCTETVTQKLFVGGVLAETHLIRFPLKKTGGSCSGTVNRT